MPWYRTGTVAVTNGSKNVVGTGTNWSAAVNVGDSFSLADANGAAKFPADITVTDDGAVVLPE